MKVWFDKDELWPVYTITDKESKYTEGPLDLSEEEIRAYEDAYLKFMQELTKLRNKLEGL